MKIKNRIEDIKEDENILIGMTKREVTCYFGHEPDGMNNNEWIYIIENYFFKLLTKRLYIFFDDREELVRDFHID